VPPCPLQISYLLLCNRFHLSAVTDRLSARDMLKTKGKKVKCTLVQALRLCTGRTAHRVSRGIALLFHDHGTRRGWGVSVTLRPLFIPGKDRVPIVQEAGWAPGPVWTGAENLPPPGFNPRTIQPVASRYTDWATRPTKQKVQWHNQMGSYVWIITTALIRIQKLREANFYHILFMCDLKIWVHVTRC